MFPRPEVSGKDFSEGGSNVTGYPPLVKYVGAIIRWCNVLAVSGVLVICKLETRKC